VFRLRGFCRFRRNDGVDLDLDILSALGTGGAWDREAVASSTLVSPSLERRKSEKRLNVVRLGVVSMLIVGGGGRSRIMGRGIQWKMCRVHFG
jgi:hypothetical protein